MGVSKYTCTIEEILMNMSFDGSYYNGKGFEELINETHKDFFNFNYPFYTDDEEVKDNFQKSFLLRYFNEYIGFETVGMFKRALCSHLNIVMEKYSKLYPVMQNMKNPLSNYDVTYAKTDDNTAYGEGESTNEHNSSSSMRDNNESIVSDNPQVTVNTNDYASGMERGERESTVEKKATDKNENKYSSKETRQSDSREYGLKGMTWAEGIKQFSSLYTNINEELIDSCKKLFLGRW